MFGWPAVIGIILGAAIGGGYVVWQRWELRQRYSLVQPRGMFALVPGAIGRLVFLVAAWWLAFRFANADKYWLTGALVVTYTAPLLVQLKQFIFPNK